MNKEKEEIFKRRQENIDDLKKTILENKKDESLMLKIKNYAERYGVPVSFVIDKLKEEDDFILFGFEKDPTRQNIYEEIQLEKIKEIPLIIEVKKLPSGGKNAKYVVDGKIVSLNAEERKEKILKSVDFYWEFSFEDKKICFFASGKYTKEEGGAQDNQRNDISSFLENAKKSFDKDLFFIALTDGEYYEKEIQKGKTRIEELNEVFCGERCLAVSSNNLSKIVFSEIKKWLLYSFGEKARTKILEIEKIESENSYNAD